MCTRTYTYACICICVSVYMSIYTERAARRRAYSRGTPFGEFAPKPSCGSPDREKCPRRLFLSSLRRDFRFSVILTFSYSRFSLFVDPQRARRATLSTQRLKERDGRCLSFCVSSLAVSPTACCSGVCTPPLHQHRSVSNIQLVGDTRVWHYGVFLSLSLCLLCS